jgi:hypothetical protein
MRRSTVRNTPAKNRLHVAEEEMANERARLIAAARRAKPVGAGLFARWSRRKEAF